MVLNRRSLLWFPAVIRAYGQETNPPYGAMAGDVTACSATVWSRSSSPGNRLHVEWSTHQDFRGSRTRTGPVAMPETGLTARIHLTGLPPGQTIFYRARFGDGQPVEGRFRTAPTTTRSVRLLWSGDMVGQGWGIRKDQDGIPIFEAMRQRQPDSFLHSGDSIYADGPVLPEVNLPGGTVWRNHTTEAKSKVAETLDEFRGNHLYNLLDPAVRRFNHEVPQVWQWDDHEVTNNWSPGKDLRDDPRYREKDIRLLVERGRRAFLEHAPMPP